MSVRLASLLLLSGAALVAIGCESTQSKSARIAEQLGPVKQEEGLEIDEESKDIEVLDTTLLSDANGTAVVVRVENTSGQDLANVPIAVNVVDAKGKSVYRNDLPGLEPALTSIPLLRAGETIDWVNNQVLAVGKPDDVEVMVGEGGEPPSGDLPDLELGDPELENDPVSGINAAGSIVNNGDEQLGRVLLYGVARQGDEIVAAGRAAIDKLNPGRSRVYHVYFIGDPKGAEVGVAWFPPADSSEQTTGGTDG